MQTDATSLIIKILHRGRNLLTDKAALIINRDKDKKVIGVSTFKKVEEAAGVSLHFVRIYTGINVNAAVNAYIDATGGGLAAIGDAVKFFREEHISKTIDTPGVVIDEQ